MSLISSLYTGISGLTTNSTELTIVGDNVANANTIGFKGSRAVFADVLGDALSEGQIGLGSKLQAVQKILTQGALVSTGLATDLAIQGQGLFMVKKDGDTFYTRAGNFTVDNDGFLTSLEGMRLQGFQTDAAGNVGTNIGDMQVGAASAPPNPTSEIIMRANLDSGAEIVAFDPLNPDATSAFSTTTTVYDTLGNPTEVKIYFEKTGDGAWTYHAMVDGGDVDGGTAGTLQELGQGTLTFDGEGKLTDVQPTTISFDPTGAAGAQTINLNFGDPTAAGGTGTGGITQFAAPSATSFLSQDGFPSGELANISIDNDGNVVGRFTNGQTRTLGQVAIADFAAPDQLERVGGNLYSETNGSGQATVGKAGTGGRGNLIAGALEQSNVDLAAEFVRMIVAQRGFQANAKTVSTADELLGELMQLKR